MRNTIIPLLLDWDTLEDIPEENNGTGEEYKCQTRADYPHVRCHMNGDTQQEESNTQFDQQHQYDIHADCQSLPLGQVNIIEEVLDYVHLTLTLSAATSRSASSIAAL